MTDSPLRNRLRKRHKHLARWAEREGITAYRLFDRDLPGYHFAVDRYGQYALVAEYPWRTRGEDARHAERREELREVLVAECGVTPSDVVFKVHGRPDSGRQPDRLATVTEGPLRFEVNLGPRLDAGLFLDHRDTRRLVRERVGKRTVLNLFCYTGAFTVAAAVGGATATLSVDLSESYLAWAKRNLALNGMKGAAHALQAGDAVAFAAGAAGRRFDLIVCDPPPASTSRRASRFDVQRDHEKLLLDLSRWLSPGGAILFSANLGGFRLSPRVLERLPGRELTPASLPPDIRPKPGGQLSHRAWLLGDPWLAN